MRAMYIPALGDQIVLAQDWSFTLHNECRNMEFAAAIGNIHFTETDFYKRRAETQQGKLPAGTVLTIKRIYIRQGQAAFNSVTFGVKVGKYQYRFWVKQADANTIQMEEQ